LEAHPARQASAAPAAQVLDRRAALDRVEGDAEILSSLIDIFFSELPAMVENIQKAVQGGDATGLERAAHRLKGSLGVLGATGSTDGALRLEMIGRGGGTGGAAEAWKDLEHQLALLRPALKEFRKSLVAPR
jgi:HPt (histidine-containing phosphotransfer) domain-containing protein